jgi:PAS domain S-box-containing protein
MNSAFRDERKWTERPSVTGVMLGQTDSMFELLFERSADAICLLEPQSATFVDCNQAAVDLLRAGSKQNLLQKRPADLSPPLQPDGSTSETKTAEVIALTEQNGGYRFEWVARRFDGEVIPLEVLTTPIEANGRKLFVVVSRDISERKQAEAAFRESQQLLASVADNISEAIYRTGPDHSLIFANRAYLRKSGYESIEEMQRIPREQLYANPEDRARLLRALQKTGFFRNEVIEYLSRDGHHWWGLSNAVAIRDAATVAVLYHVGSVSDVTEQKRTEQKILELNASLERRIKERTAELSASEARLKTLVEHASEAIVVFDGDTGKFMFGNAHTC